MNSFFSRVDPIVRDNPSHPLACGGMKPSCELCPSYLSEAHKVGKWLLDVERLDAIDNAKKSHNWLIPASTELYASDVSEELRGSIYKVFENNPDQTFFVNTKNIQAMMQEWLLLPNVIWGYSASTQAEVNFLGAIRGDEEHLQREALFLTPLVEEVFVPKNLLKAVEYIFITGCEGVDDHEGWLREEFAIDWLEHIEEQAIAAGSEARIIVDSIGDHPTFNGEPIKTNRKKFHHKSIKEIVAMLT